MQPHLPGDFLRVRGDVWRLRSQVAHADCAELELDPLGQRIDTPPRVLLTPFDRPTALTPDPAPRVVTRRAWMRALLEQLLLSRRSDALTAPATAAIDILPYQLEPAIAMVLGGIPRVLLADAVGLGKTIQAALIIAELHARHARGRTVILTPSGLRDQWAAELRERFGLDAVVADSTWLRDARAELPASVNPWSTPQILIASMDFVKRPEVRGGLDSLVWDLLIVDEAHAASADSERRAAADAIGRRARRVLLLTATPHAGDPAAYDALCRVGSLTPDEPIVLFRRSRRDLGFAIERRVHLMPVRLTPAEHALHARLLAYVSRVWRERQGDAGGEARLATIVLLKRALSSMASLTASLEFRLEHLADPAGAMLDQPTLPLGEDSDSADEVPVCALAAPGFDDGASERHVLSALARDARLAARADSKMRALCRWVGRVSEPCIVFTEYRDTLAAIDEGGSVTRVALHGGLDRAERAIAGGRFVGGSARVLLATDAGGEGLNLQANCRLVFNLELPWNPIRLEQRIGRVDRIGQRRTVHAVNLVASGTHEASLLSRLVRRLDCIRESFGEVDAVLGPAGEAVIADILMKEPATLVPWLTQLELAPPARVEPVVTLGLATDAASPGMWLREQRSIWLAWERRRHIGARSPCRPPGPRLAPWAAAMPLRRVRGVRVPPGVIAIYRSVTVDAGGRLVDEAIIPLWTPLGPGAARPLPRRAEAAAFLAWWLPPLRPGLDAAALDFARARLDAVRSAHARISAAGMQREHQLQMLAAGGRTPFQAGLFDRRAERACDAQQQERTAQEEELLDAGWVASRGCVDLAGNPSLELLLLVTP